MKKFVFYLTMFSLFFIELSATAVAESPNETENNYFRLKSSSIIDGDTDVDVNSIIELTFTENIADITVAKRNSNCFSLMDSNGNAVKINVIYADLQIQPLYKTSCFISPTKPLKCNETYTLTVSDTLITKKEHPINSSYSINFTTSEHMSSTTWTNSKLETLGDDILVYEIENAVHIETTVSQTAETHSNTDESYKNITTCVGIFLIAVTVFITISNIRKNNQKNLSGNT